MSLTLADYRGLLRRKLEDTTGSPMWADQLLDDGLRNALDQYSGYRPAERTATLTLADGDTSAALPADCRWPLRLTREADGWIFPRATRGWNDTADLEAAWETFGSSIYFTGAMSAGDHTLWYRGPQTFPASDVTAWPTPDEEAGLIVALALLYCLTEFSVQEWKRGPLPTRFAFVLQQAKSDVEREWQARRRVVRVGLLDG